MKLRHAVCARWWPPAPQVGRRGPPQVCTVPACRELVTGPVQRTALLLRAHEVCVRRPELPRLRPSRLLRAPGRLRALRSPQRSARQQLPICTAAPGDQHLAEQATSQVPAHHCISGPKRAGHHFTSLFITPSAGKGCAQGYSRPSAARRCAGGTAPPPRHPPPCCPEHRSPPAALRHAAASRPHWQALAAAAQPLPCRARTRRRHRPCRPQPHTARPQG